MHAWAVSLAVAALAACSDSGSSGEGASSNWVATWHSAVVDDGKSAGALDDAEFTGNITYRLLIHGALGGGTVRLRFSNRYGREALVIRNVSIALPSSPAKLPAVDPATVTPLTFGGKSEVSIPPGGEFRTDPATFALPADSDVAATFYLPGTVTNITGKSNSLTTSWSNSSTGGDDSADAIGTTLLSMEPGWPFLTGLEVTAPGATTVVALGDSITDGAFELPNLDTRWPDLLADRIATSDLAGRRSVVNAGISGNMVTADRDGNATQGQAAITRMAWDVFELPNVSHIILYEGINDVCVGVPGDGIVNGLRTVVAEAHRRGVKVVAATLTPAFGALLDTNCTANDGQRAPVNEWVLNSGEADGAIDFNAAVSTGLDPDVWLPHLTLDFLHPNPLGLVVMAQAIPLDLLR